MSIIYILQSWQRLSCTFSNIKRVFIDFTESALWAGLEGNLPVPVQAVLNAFLALFVGVYQSYYLYIIVRDVCLH